MITDRLQQGRLKAWGRQSDGFPNQVGGLRPVRTYINPKFWTENTIAELDFWMERGRFQSQNSPALTVTNPVAAHPAATHYWDLSFSTKDAFDLWG
jgi:hypothetical protein